MTERLVCVSVRVPSLVRQSPPGKVNCMLAVEMTTMWQVFLFCWLFCGRGKKREGRNVKFFGISGCSCVSFDLAVTTCFHTITAHPLTSTATPKKEKKKEFFKKKVRKDEQRGATRMDTVFI